MAKEEHAGPMLRRQSSSGGEAFQSSDMEVPDTRLSRSGPLNPGHWGSVSNRVVETEGVIGSLRELARSISSEVGDHRQVKRGAA